MVDIKDFKSYVRSESLSLTIVWGDSVCRCHSVRDGFFSGYKRDDIGGGTKHLLLKEVTGLCLTYNTLFSLQ